MTKTQIDSEAKSAGIANMQPRSGKVPTSTVHTYASGIEEREGSVPMWLWVVVATLLMWGFYYLIAYWDSPIGPA